MLFIGCGVVSAQTAGATTTAQNKGTQSPAKLIDAANQYKASSKELLSLQEDTIKINPNVFMDCQLYVFRERSCNRNTVCCV